MASMLGRSLAGQVAGMFTSFNRELKQEAERRAREES